MMVTRVVKSVLLLLALILVPALVFGAEGVKLRHVLSIYLDSKEGIIKVPQGVAARGNLVIVADSGNGRLLKYSYQDGILKGGDEIRVTEVAYPETIRIGAQGDMYVLDGKQRRIAKLGPDGAFKGFIKAEGIPDPSEYVPMGFCLDGTDNMYILDVFTARVIVLDPSGKYVKSMDFPAGYGFISDIGINPKGDIFLLDSVRSMIFALPKGAKEFTPLTASMKEDMKFAVNLGIDSKGFIFVADQNSGGIVIIAPDGSYQGRQGGYGWREGLLRYPCQLSFNEKDELFIADRENGRIQIFAPVK
jgi:hypothetical protein